MPHSLPDDISRWPGDPYELLGIPRGADIREIKRAYAQLLRQYRPDEHPAGFQKLREAFEAATEYARFRTQFFSNDDSDPVALNQGAVIDRSSKRRDLSSPSSDKESHAKDQPIPAMLRSDSSRANPLEDHGEFAEQHHLSETPWNVAVSGDSRGAWRLLEEQSRNSTNREETAVQRYWLAKLTFDLTDRAPEEFLFNAAKSIGLTGRIWPLLMLEWGDNPQRLLSSVIYDLLEVPENMERLVPLFAARWKSAGKAGLWSLFKEDLAHLRNRLLPDHATMWLTALVEQMRFGIWMPKSEEAEHWQESWFAEIAQLSDLQLKASFQFDEAEQWHDLRRELFDPAPRTVVSAQIRELLWSMTFDNRIEVKTCQAKLVDSWVSDLDEAFCELDALATSCPITLTLLLQNSQWDVFTFVRSPFTESPPDYCRQVFKQLIGRILQNHPNAARTHMASFCLRELISIDEFCSLAIEYAPADWSTHVRLLVDDAASDVSLRCLCQLARLVEME